MLFAEYLKKLDFDRLVRLWNEFCFSENGSAEDAIYDSIEELSSQGICTGLELTRAVFFGDVQGWYDHVSFDGYGNLYSVHTINSSPIDMSLLVEYLIKENHDVYQEWADEYDVEDEDEEV